MKKTVECSSCRNVVACKSDKGVKECKGCTALSVCQERHEQLPSFSIVCTLCATKEVRPTVKIERMELCGLSVEGI